MSFVVGVQVSPQMQSIADELVRENSVDTWTTVDYSPSYKLSFLEGFGNRAHVEMSVATMSYLKGLYQL